MINPKHLAAFAGRVGAAPSDDEDEESEEAMSGEEQAPDVDAAAAEIEAAETPDALDSIEVMDGYDPEVDGNPPAWVGEEDEPVWERAKEAVDPEGAGAHYSDPWAVVAHVYKKMGGVVEA